MRRLQTSCTLLATSPLLPFSATAIASFSILQGTAKTISLSALLEEMARRNVSSLSSVSAPRLSIAMATPLDVSMRLAAISQTIENVRAAWREEGRPAAIGTDLTSGLFIILFAVLVRPIGWPRPDAILPARPIGTLEVGP